MSARPSSSLTWVGSTLALVVMLGLPPTLGSPRAKGRKQPQRRVVPQKVRDLLQVFHDGKGHYFVAGDQLKGLPTATRNLLTRNVYFGSKRQVYHLAAHGTYHHTSPRAYTYIVRDPRRGNSKLHVGGDKVHYRCGATRTPLSRLSPAAAKRFLSKVTFRERFWSREPHLLARNDEGEYFFTDRALATTRSGGLRFRPTLAQLRGFRLWRGRRGRMKRLKLQDVVTDAAGQIFLTKKGALHVTMRKRKLRGARGRFARQYQITTLSWRNRRTNKRDKLTRVPLESAFTTELIHRHLGPYTGAKFGLPCDVW
jgi:hypothetical protein